MGRDESYAGELKWMGEVVKWMEKEGEGMGKEVKKWGMRASRYSNSCFELFF